MSFFDTLLGNDAAATSNAAAADQYAKQQAATKNITNYGNEYADKFKGLSTQYQPYQQAGGSALARLMQGLGLPGGDGSDFAAAYRATPGYQAGLDTGTNAAISGANAGGTLASGRTLKALQRYGSDYNDQKSGAYMSQLAGLQGQGLQATNQAVNTEGQGLQGQLQTRQSAYNGDMNSAGTIGQGMVAGATAQAQGVGNIFNTGANLLGIGIGTNWGQNPTNLQKTISQGKSAYSPQAYQPSPWG